MRRVALPPLEGRLVDATATIDDGYALLSIATEKDGRRTHGVHLVSDAGEVLASSVGAPESRPLLASVFGKSMAYGSILCATDDGLLLVQPDAARGNFLEHKSFPQTRDFVSSGTDILAGPHGSVYLVENGEIVHLSLG
jgi:hypothetical protein